MKLTQKQLAERLRVSTNSVARMERDEMIVTPPMELLVCYIAAEAGVDFAYPKRGGGHAEGKRAHSKTAKAPARKARKAV